MDTVVGNVRTHAHLVADPYNASKTPAYASKGAKLVTADPIVITPVHQTVSITFVER
jgi:hypothetical protein